MKGRWLDYNIKETKRNIQYNKIQIKINKQKERDGVDKTKTEKGC